MEAPISKIKSNLRRTYNYSLNKAKCKKILHNDEVLGCNYIDFVKHIESLWEPNMDWSNYGGKERNGWEFDHIVSRGSIDYNDLDQIKFCYNYKNIQPLWIKENAVKNSIIQNLKKENAELKLEIIKLKQNLTRANSPPES